MKKQLTLMLGMAVFALVLSGCAWGNSDRSKLLREAMPDDLPPDAQAIAAIYIKGFEDALRDNDFSKFERVVPADSKDMVSEKAFNQMYKELVEKLGTLKNTQYLGELNQTLVVDYIWKFGFEKEELDKDKKPRITRKEVLYLARVGLVDGKYMVVGSGFRF